MQVGDNPEDIVLTFSIYAGDTCDSEPSVVNYTAAWYSEQMGRDSGACSAQESGINSRYICTVGKWTMQMFNADDSDCSGNSISEASYGPDPLPYVDR